MFSEDNFGVCDERFKTSFSLTDPVSLWLGVVGIDNLGLSDELNLSLSVSCFCFSCVGSFWRIFSFLFSLLTVCGNRLL